MTLQLVDLYRKKNPDTEIIYQCAASVKNILEPLMLQAGIDRVITTDETLPADHTYRLIGYPIAQGYPERPMQEHLLTYFARELGLMWRGESMTLDLPARPTNMPERYCTVQLKTGWSNYKEWPKAYWEELIASFPKDLAVVQIGAAGEPRIQGTHDGLGLAFMQSLATFANAEFHMGPDSWSNHATMIRWRYPDGVVKKQNAVILWGSTQISAAGYPHNLNLTNPQSCQPCFKENPAISAASRGPCQNPPNQEYAKPQHACLVGLKPATVLAAMDREGFV